MLGPTRCALIFTTDVSSKTANISKRSWKGAVRVGWTWYFSSQLLLGYSPQNLIKVLLLLSILLPEEEKGDLFSERHFSPTRILRLRHSSPHSSSHGTFWHPFPMASNLCPSELSRGHGGYIQKEETKTKNYLWKPWHHNGDQKVPSNYLRNGFSDSVTPQLDTSTGAPPPACDSSSCILLWMHHCQPRGELQAEPSPTPCAREISWKQHLCWKKSKALQEMWCPQQFLGWCWWRLWLSKHLECPQHGKELLWPEEPCGEPAAGTGSNVGVSSKCRDGHTNTGQDSQGKLLTAVVQLGLGYSKAL